MSLARFTVFTTVALSFLLLAHPASAQGLSKSFAQERQAPRYSSIAWEPAPKRSSLRPVAVGAVIGATAGVIVLFSADKCRTGESMCGLSIPLYAGGGALIGGFAGYLWTRLR